MPKEYTLNNRERAPISEMTEPRGPRVMPGGYTSI